MLMDNIYSMSHLINSSHPLVWRRLNYIKKKTRQLANVNAVNGGKKEVSLYIVFRFGFTDLVTYF